VPADRVIDQRLQRLLAQEVGAAFVEGAVDVAGETRGSF